jgi:hypothetical protein
LPDSIEIAILDTSENADPSIKATFWGIMIKLRKEQE